MAASSSFLAPVSNLELEGFNAFQMLSIPILAFLISLSLIYLRKVIRNTMNEGFLIKENVKNFKIISYMLFMASISIIFVPNILTFFSLNLRIMTIPISVEAILIFTLGLLSLLISNIFHTSINDK
jgi:hypothetical protein